MFNQLGPIEVNCDAPPYSIVKACRRIGIETPEDVRWCRVSHLFNQPTGWQALLHTPPWKLLLGKKEPEDRICTCGQPLPELETVTFTFATGEEAIYLIGQCGRCRTVFWEHAGV